MITRQTVTFFYSIIDENRNLGLVEDIKYYDLFHPTEVAVFLGGIQNGYQLSPLTKSDDYNIAADGITVIQRAFETGIPMEGVGLTQQLWQRPHILMMLPFAYDKTILAENLDVNVNLVPEDVLVDRVYIYPSRDVGDTAIDVVMTDDRHEAAFGYEIPLDDERLLNNSLIRYLESGVEDGKTLYISTYQNQMNMFDSDRLLPGGGQTFNLLEFLYGERQFYYGGERNVEEIQAFVDYFFINPENTWRTIEIDEVRFGDLEALISYMDSGLLSYRLIAEVNPRMTSLNARYDVVQSFLEKDTLLSQIEYRLAGYDTDEQNDEVTFFYDYTYVGVPMVFEELKTEYGMAHPMEITVVGSTVTSYRRLMWKNQEVIMQGNPFEVRYQKPIDEFHDFYGNDEPKINDLFLGYRIGHLDEGAWLQWVMDLEDGARRFYELE